MVGAANGAVVSLSQEDAKRLFLGQQLGSRLVPYDQEDDLVRERFYRALADMSPHSVRAYWAKRVFTGRGRPPARLSSEQTKTAIRQERNAVSYLPAEHAPPGVSVLLKLGAGD